MIATRLLSVALGLAVVSCGGSTPPAEAPPAEAPETPGGAGASDAPAAGGDSGAAPGTAEAAVPAPGSSAAAAADKPLGGALTPDDVRAVVEKHGELFNDCYSLGAGKGQQFTGTVTLKVTLGPTGTVNEVLVAKSTAKNPKVDQCVVDGFKKIKFPPPKSGATSVFTFPMVFGGAVEAK
ncbi:MAG: AgmX/PglI C-terminal domain-containing protein [Polyangiaceae bacterium]